MGGEYDKVNRAKECARERERARRCMIYEEWGRGRYSPRGETTTLLAVLPFSETPGVLPLFAFLSNDTTLFTIHGSKIQRTERLIAINSGGAHGK